MLSRDLDGAQKAYKSGDIELSKKYHEVRNSESQIERENHSEKHKLGGEFLKSATFGGLDGLITTYSVIAGSMGADLELLVILILGIATMLGDSIAMAFGDYLSTKSEIEYQRSEKKREEWEVDNNPEGEKLEMIDIYKNRGLNEEDAILMSNTISKSKNAWVEIMMVEELGIVESNESPGKNAIVTFFSFNLCGILTLIPYIIARIGSIESNNDIFIASTVVTAAAAYFLGAIKTSFTNQKWYISGFESLVVTVTASGIAYVIGYLLEPLAHD